MEFINKGVPVKIRIGGVMDCHWATIKKGEIVNLPARAGLSYGLTPKTTQGKIGNKLIETKQISVPQKDVQNDFLKELVKIKGIGIKTAKDIIKIFPEREELTKIIRASNDTNALPFRDDISKILVDIYGPK